MKLRMINPDELKKYEASFIEAVSTGALDIRSEKECIVVDTVLPPEIIRKADRRLRRKKFFQKIRNALKL